MIARWTNMICGVLLAIAALGFAIFLPENVADYEQEPEDVWLIIVWIAFLSLLAALCFANAKRPKGTLHSGWLAAANGAAVTAVAALSLLILDSGEAAPFVLLFCVSALGPAVALIATWQASSTDAR